MTRERLVKLSLDDLKLLAELFGVDADEAETDRAALESSIFEAMEDARTELEQVDTFPIAYHQRRFEGVDELFGQHPASLEGGFDFPEAYNVTRIELMLRDPAWAFCYWDIAAADRTRILRSKDFDTFFLRLEEVNKKKNRDELHIMDVPVQITDQAWYLNLQNRETQYQVSLCAQNDGTEDVLATSRLVSVPLGGLTRKLEIMDSFETDSLIALSGIEKLGASAMPNEIPQRILSIRNHWEE